jgi:hypothetical protein
MMLERTGALSYFGDARRAAVGTELIERVAASGSLVIRKLGQTRAGELPNRYCDVMDPFYFPGLAGRAPWSGSCLL